MGSVRLPMKGATPARPDILLLRTGLGIHGLNVGESGRLPTAICWAAPSSADEQLAPEFVQRLLLPQSWVLDGDEFVEITAALPRTQLQATLENCLLECTNTRLRPGEQTTPAKVDLGAAGLLQRHMLGAEAQLELFASTEGLPRLSDLLHSVVLPPSATSQLISAPAAQVFSSYIDSVAGRHFLLESYDMGSMPVLFEHPRSHVRSAAVRGTTVYTLFSGMPSWQRFELVAGHTVSTDSLADKGTNQSNGAAKQPQAFNRNLHHSHQQQRLFGAAGSEPHTLISSACSCSRPDLGTLWCHHRCDAMAALLGDTALHVVDMDALHELLAPLSNRQLAQLLLTVAFACGTLADAILSLELPENQQAACFLRKLCTLPLEVPSSNDLAQMHHDDSEADMMPVIDPYHGAGEGRAPQGATPSTPFYLNSRLSVQSGLAGSVLEAVYKHVKSLGPELVWQLKQMGVDALDSFPEAQAVRNASGGWPMSVQQAPTLGVDNALALAGALDLLGGGYKSVALRLLKDVTRTIAHPYYQETLILNLRSLARRLAQLWERLSTAAQRWEFFMEGGMRLPCMWSDVVREVAWQVVGQFPVLWSIARQLDAASSSVARSAAMVLATRSSLLPPNVPSGNGSVYKNLLTFERGMRAGPMRYAQGAWAFLITQDARFRAAQEGSLMQLAACSMAQQLLVPGRSLAQCAAEFDALILDLQEAVLAEVARLLQKKVADELPTLSHDSPDLLDVFLPHELRNAGSALKASTIGVLDTGFAFNADGLLRDALPQHLPPPLASAPFNWVTMDLNRMLNAQPWGAAACWACAYLQLVQQQYRTDAMPQRTWMHQAGMLGTLVGSAHNAANQGHWHAAAMLADAAAKYISTSASLTPGAARLDPSLLPQLQAARDTLLLLAQAATTQLQAFIQMHKRGAVLTYSSSLRACCVVLCGALSLLGEVLEPAVLQRPAVVAQGTTAVQLVPDYHHLLAGGMTLAEAQTVRLYPIVEAQVHQPQHAHGTAPQQQAALQQPAGAAIPSTPSLAAASVEGSGVQPPAETAEGLAADARLLIEAYKTVLQLVQIALDAEPLLSPYGVHSKLDAVAGRRQYHDTALWRGSELMRLAPTAYAYHAAHADAQAPRPFILDDISLLLSQLLPLALLPLRLLEQPAQDQRAVTRRSTRSRGRAVGPAGAGLTATGGSAAGAPFDQAQAVFEMVPQLDRLASKLLECEDETSTATCRGNNLVAFGKKVGASLSLACTLAYLAATASSACARRLAAMPNAWKLLSSPMLGVLVTNTAVLNSQKQSERLLTLVPPTVLCMLQACTVSAAPEVSGAPACGAHLAVKGVASRGEPASNADCEVAGPSCKRRRISRQKARPHMLPKQDHQAALAASSVPEPYAPSQLQAVQAHHCLQADGQPVDVGPIHAVARMLCSWLLTGVKEHWNGSNFASPSNRTALQPPGTVQLDAAPLPMVQQAAAAVLEAPGPQIIGAGAGVAPAMQLPAAPPPGGGGQVVQPQQLPAVHSQAGTRPAATPPAVPARRRAFIRATTGSLAVLGSWPLSTVQVLQWWLQHRHQLKACETAVTAPSRTHQGDQTPANPCTEPGLPGQQPPAVACFSMDNRVERFVTMDGWASLGPEFCGQGPTLGTLGGTLILLLCMECAPDLHVAAASALKSLAAQPGAAPALANCEAYWALQRLLLQPALPPLAKHHGREVVRAVESTLLAQSGGWAAVLKAQEGLIADTEAQVAERRRLPTFAIHYETLGLHPELARLVAAGLAPMVNLHGIVPPRLEDHSDDGMDMPASDEEYYTDSSDGLDIDPDEVEDHLYGYYL